MKKAKVNHEVAEAIRTLKAKKYTVWEVISDSSVGVQPGDKEADYAIYTIGLFANGNGKNQIDFVNAYLNGYEIANEEDLLLIEYEDAMFRYKEDRHLSEKEKNIALGKAQGILRTLDILGMKIDGLNN